VATGASTLGFAGSKDFLERHRKQLRGALVFTVTGVGAGTVSILTTEGSIEKRRVDRRIMRTVKGVSKDLHIDLDEVPRPWADTDATPFMRNSIRSASIVGLDAGDVIAYAHTQEDVIENIDMRQITQVAQLITEAIRRS
jgi:Zn-dependent M28 family amino/carboxypeptidase